MNTRERLIELIADNNLERREVAELLKVKRDEVDYWLLPNDSKNHVEAPEMAVELLEYKMRDRKSAE